MKIPSSLFVSFDIPTRVYKLVVWNSTLNEIVMITVEDDDATMKTILKSKRVFGFGEKLVFWCSQFSNKMQLFTEKVCIGGKIVNMSPVIKNLWKGNCVDGPILNRNYQPIALLFSLCNPQRSKCFWEPQKPRKSKIVKSYFQKISFCLRDDRRQTGFYWWNYELYSIIDIFFGVKQWFLKKMEKRRSELVGDLIQVKHFLLIVYLKLIQFS